MPTVQVITIIYNVVSTYIHTYIHIELNNFTVSLTLIVHNTYIFIITFNVSYCTSRYGNVGVVKSKHNIFSNQLWILCIENYLNKDKQNEKH